MTLLPVGSNIIIINLMFALKYHTCFIFSYLSSFTERIFKPNHPSPRTLQHPQPPFEKIFSCKLNFNHYSVVKTRLVTYGECRSYFNRFK